MTNQILVIIAGILILVFPIITSSIAMKRHSKEFAGIVAFASTQMMIGLGGYLIVVFHNFSMEYVKQMITIESLALFIFGLMWMEWGFGILERTGMVDSDG